MDYYARLLELLPLLAPDKQAEVVELAELLAASSAQPLQVRKEETPAVPGADETPHE